MSLAVLGLAFAAGLVSILSPCVLPLLPLVVAAAADASRFGPVALAGGVMLSFVAIGLFVATIGFSLGLDGDVFRNAGAVVVGLVGLALLIPAAQTRLAFAAGPVSGWADRRIARLAPSGAPGQFLVGLLIGVIWSPCVGPTLGAASALAARGESLGAVAATMLAFGLGAAAPLVAVGSASRQALARWRGGLIAGASVAKLALGAILVLTSVAVLTGFDRRVETFLTEASPGWLTTLTTQF